jgi:outer membrane protein assembly factor BamB
VAVSAAVVIDLGEDWSVAEDLPARRRMPRARGPLAALLAVAVLLLVGASVPPRPPFIALVTIAGQGVVASDVGGGGLFIASQASGRRVARYPLRGGEPTWDTTVAISPMSLIYLRGPEVLLVTSFDNEQNRSQFTVLDAATGHPLWGGGGNLVLGQIGNDAGPPSSGGLLVSDAPTGSTLQYVELRSGRTIWSRPLAALTQIVPVEAAGRPQDAGYLLAADDGTLTMLAQETGVLLATRQIDRLVPPSSTGFDPEHNTVINAVGDQLVVMRQDGALHATLSSYDLPGLTLRWSRTDAVSGYPYGCGPLLCLLGSQGELVALDPFTGSDRWRAPGWQAAEDMGGGRLLGYRPGNGERTGILDAANGRLVRDIGDPWTPLNGWDSGQAFKLFTAPEAGNYRYTWFGVLDPYGTQVRPLTRLEGVGTQGCDLHGDLLVCRMLDARLRVWRFQP